MIFKFHITSKENDVLQFEKELLDILLRLAGDKEMIAHEIHFCVHEAILNIIQHTYKWDLDNPLDIQITISEIDPEAKHIEVSIRDNGPPIKDMIIPPQTIEKFQLRRRGLYMISKIMDSFSVEPLSKTGNITHMKKIIPAQAEEAIARP